MLSLLLCDVSFSGGKTEKNRGRGRDTPRSRGTVRLQSALQVKVGLTDGRSQSMPGS